MTSTNLRMPRGPRNRRLWYWSIGFTLAVLIVAAGVLTQCQRSRLARETVGLVGVEPAADAATPVFGGIPRSQRPLHVLHNSGYWEGYDEARHDPAWVGFRVRGPALHARLPRPAFEVDARTDARVRPDDFVRSGYDRGHMAPNYAIGSRLGANAQHETFLLSNICPQRPSLNRGLWQRLEARESGPRASERPWAEELGEVDVLVGPIFASDDAVLPSGVEVPHAFYRIVVDPGKGVAVRPGGDGGGGRNGGSGGNGANGGNGGNGGRPRVLAFIVPNSNEVGSDVPEHFLVSVHEVETETGLDFMPDIAQPLQEQLERAVATSLWP
jgi:endonuclease G